jgi:hypothetical protein
MNIILQIQGGIGKCVMATAVCEAIKKQYSQDQLIVISGHPDVFLNNPNVDRAFGYGRFSYFYNEFVDKKDVKIMAHDPYLETTYVRQDEHLIKIWCEMNGVSYNGEKPNIHLSSPEIEFFSTKITSDKPILVIQPNGGGDINMKYSWSRDLPPTVVVQVIEHFRKNYNIIHIKREDQPNYDHTFQFLESFRAAAVLIHMSSKRLFIDSFSQHVAASINKHSTVCWVSTSPKVFGYDVHDNILSNPETRKPDLRNSFYTKYSFGGDIFENPYNKETDIFTVDKIINSIQQQ